MKPRLAVALGALGIAGAMALSGCASSDKTEKKPGANDIAAQVKQSVSESGDKLVSIRPYRVSCSQGQHNLQNTFQCPMIGADWTSARPGIGRLTIGVPDLKGQDVTGADFHLGASEVVRVRNKASVQPSGLTYPATSFDVPLTFVEKLAYGPRTWVRVYTGEQRYIDAMVNSGEDTAQAVEGLAYFMRSVDTSSGRSPSDVARGGGLFDRLGLGDEKGSSNSKGVEGMHPR
ncbi:hypothetical protein G7048_00950 [Diaphorobacter sp. HDW4B]|uniref:hypothetical protein n=1 Tax=Diaphorobacter sp. HDW4B TaxID=2714925 RepID=UPI00140D23B5|nr:hypothetical protein [Diaphorobacter sp. HDW4B]QIL69084.1 hypothetical protein G7048_00950 [Diaphorobacter sp. HDW4B]